MTSDIIFLWRYMYKQPQLNFSKIATSGDDAAIKFDC